MEQNKKRKLTVTAYAVLLGATLMAGTYFLIKLRATTNVISAQVTSAVVSILPAIQELPPDAPVSVAINVDTNPIVFAKVVVNFDFTKVQLTSAPVVNATFANVVSQSTMEEANTTGRIVVAAGVRPGTPAPSGTISDFITFTLSPLSLEPNDAITLSLVTGEMQIIESAGITAMPLITNNAIYTLNPVPSPSPSPTPEHSPSPSPTPEPSPSPTPEPSPSPSPTPTPTPSPSPTADTTLPTVTLTNPSNGAVIARNSSLTMQADASDNVGVTRVEFWASGKKKCTDTVAPYTCAWTAPTTIGTVPIQAKAFDAAGNIGTHSITITVN